MKALIYGNITVDENITESGTYKGLGGAAYFAAQTLDNLGCEYHVVSPYGKDIPLKDIKKLHLFPFTPTTTQTLKFYNIIYHGKRRQKIKYLDGSENIKPLLIPEKLYKDIDILLISPILDNISLGVFKDLVTSVPKDCLVVILAQGFFRSIGKDKNILNKSGKHLDKYLPYADIVFLSEEDTYNATEKAMLWSRGGVTAVVTQGEKGCVVSVDGKSVQFPGFKSKNILDSTGAGDVFAASFSYWIATKEDSVHAALIANAIAALSITMPKNKLDFTLKALKNIIGH